MDICPKCGLPLEACVCEEIAKQEQKITVTTEKKRYGKIVTTVSGLRDVNIKEIAKKLKSKLACGGTIKGNKIELQGDHRRKMKPLLIELGFSEESVED